MIDAWKELRGYAGPSDPRRSRPSRFWMRHFWQVYVSAIEPHITRRGGRRRWFDVERAERRKFDMTYGYNPRCCHKGTYGKPGFGHWQRQKN